MENKEETVIIRNTEDLAEYLSVTVGKYKDKLKEAIASRVYKNTDCGAWVKFTETGIILGSIVEGSEAEVDTDELTFPFTSEDYEKTIEHIECEVDILWREANCEESEEDED